MRIEFITRRTLLLLALFAALLRPFTAPAADADPNEVFTVVLLPDTQFYSEKYPDTYVARTISRIESNPLRERPE